MPKKKVCAVFMHEDEHKAIIDVASNIESTESFVIGEVEEDQIEKLKDKGISVRIMEDQRERKATPGLITKHLSIQSFDKFIRGAGFNTISNLDFSDNTDLDSSDDNFDATKPNVFLIKLTGPILDQRRNELASLGVKLLEHIPDNSYTAFLTIEQVTRVRGLDYVQSVELYSKEDTSAVSTAKATSLSNGQNSIKEIKAFDVRLHREEDLNTVTKWLHQQNGLIAGTGKSKIRLYAFHDSPIIDDISSLPEVASVEEFIKPKFFNDVARRLMNIDSQNGNISVPNISQTGAGQIVGVADTGIDENHPDFNGRIIGKVALGRPGDTSDPAGHGTHVAGSILGDGSASNGKIKGVAPQAKLYFQSLLDANNELGGLPLSLHDLFDDAYINGARIHNNSWGANTNSTYTFNAIEVDDFVSSHKDMLIVIAAGNEGASADPPANSLSGPKKRLADSGFVDWLTIGSPATAKNALTIGASRSNRTEGGLSNFKYGEGWPSYFPQAHPPVNDDISQQTVSGNPESIAAFSSRGPCDDRRIKPDLVAPGTDIVSTKSSSASIKHFWGPYNNFNGSYAYMGGTSMATPLVAGCAALVREYYLTKQNHHPSAALLKATLINGAKVLSGADAVAKEKFYHQGFGCINMVKTIPNPTIPNLHLEFQDTYNTPALQFNNTGQRFRFLLQLTGGSFLRVCIAYTDAPGRGLQNNLNLMVDCQDPQTGKRTKWIGNDDVNNGLNLPDPDNNVERVWLEGSDFKQGTYTIMLFASNLLKVPQDFALVITSDTPFTLTRI